jgi:predicted enzyme related to lactoylglutathione lyase
VYKKEQAKLKLVNYFSVESIDDFIKKIKALGGKMIGPKQEVTNVGLIALAVDPEGNQFAIMQPE